MPSSNKTSRLGLNQWLGSDKPKKDDFNNDNRLLDAATADILTRLADAKTQADANARSLGDHAANTATHVSSAEKALWNAPRETLTIGAYTGNGAMTRTISLGFRAAFGVLYAVGMGPVQADWSGYESRVYSGCFGESGCSRNIVLENNGFTVTHNATRPLDGCSYKYNESGVTYVYAAWKR